VSIAALGVAGLSIAVLIARRHRGGDDARAPTTPPGGDNPSPQPTCRRSILMTDEAQARRNPTSKVDKR
jgi:hypothetical protein